MPKFLQIIFAIVFSVITVSCGVALAQEPQATAAFGRKIDADIVICRNNELAWNHVTHYHARHMRAPYDITGPDGQAYTIQAHETFTTICREYVKKIEALSATPAPTSVATQTAAKPVETAQQTTKASGVATGHRFTRNELVDIVREQGKSISTIKHERSVLLTIGIFGIFSILLSILICLIALFNIIKTRNQKEKENQKNFDHDFEMDLRVAQTAAQTAAELAEVRANKCASLTHQLETMERARDEALAEIERLKSLPPAPTQIRTRRSGLTLPRSPIKWSAPKTMRLVHLELSEERFKQVPGLMGSDDSSPSNRLVQLEVHLNDEGQPVCNFFISDGVTPYRGEFFEYTSDENALAQKLYGDSLAVQKMEKRNLRVVRYPGSKTTGWFNKPTDSIEAEMLPTREQLIKELGGKVSEA